MFRILHSGANMRWRCQESSLDGDATAAARSTHQVRTSDANTIIVFINKFPKKNILPSEFVVDVVLTERRQTLKLHMVVPCLDCALFRLFIYFKLLTLNKCLLRTKFH